MLWDSQSTILDIQVRRAELMHSDIGLCVCVRVCMCVHVCVRVCVHFFTFVCAYRSATSVGRGIIHK